MFNRKCVLTCDSSFSWLVGDLLMLGLTTLKLLSVLFLLRRRAGAKKIHHNLLNAMVFHDFFSKFRVFDSDNTFTKHSSNDTLSDIIITDYIVTGTSFHGHNYSRSIVSRKFFIFRTANSNFRLKE